MNADRLLDCGSGCRGFDPRHSPQITAETPGADCPLVPPGAPGSTGYSSNTVQQPERADLKTRESGTTAGPHTSARCACPHAADYQLRTVFRLRVEREALRSEVTAWRWISAALGVVLVGAFLALAYFCGQGWR